MLGSLMSNNMNPLGGLKSVASGYKNIIQNTNLTSLLMTAASRYFGGKQKVLWYFSPAQNYTDDTSVVNPDGVIQLPKKSSLTTQSVLPSAFFIDVSVSHNGRAVGAPVEEGSYNLYNKVSEPITLDATLAFDENKGSYLSVQWAGLKTKITTKNKAMKIKDVINRLILLKKSPIMFSVVTPTHEYKNMTLESCDYTFSRENGYGVLFAKCKFKEIPEIKVDTLTPEQVKSKDCATAKPTGTAKPQVPTSVAKDAASQNGGFIDKGKALIKKAVGK